MCRISQNSNLANANHCSNYQAEKKMNVKGEKKRSNTQICKLKNKKKKKKKKQV